MGNPTNELRAKLDELGVRWWPDVYYRDTNTCWRVGDFEWRASEQKDGKLIIGCTCVKYLTPEQAIAATVGVTEDEADARDLMEAIRDDDGVRYSMDEVMDIMGEDVAATVGNAQEPSNAVIERIERFCTDYAQCLMDSTILVKCNYESMDRMAVEKAEVVEDRLIRELAEDVATAGNAGYGIQFADWCEFPPETMVGETVFDGEGNAIGWIVDATVGKDIEHYDGSGRRGTVAILQGGRKPEEVMFVGEDGGVTHYLPEGAGTCHLEECEHEREVPHDLPDCDGGWYTEVTHDCDECGYENADPNIRFCGGCGRKVVAE